MQLKKLPQDSEDKLIADVINEEAFPECEGTHLMIYMLLIWQIELKSSAYTMIMLLSDF